MLRLSQGHLNLLETCPPKFQQSYLTLASSLPNPETEERQTWGSRFHLLMQQRELGLSITSLLEEDTELDRSLKALVQAAPELLTNNSQQKREAEHSRTLSFGNYLLTVIYDLLIAEEEQAKIIDWKTYLKPEKRAKLARNWQTRLYLYVLAETSDYSPEQISMTYWFVKLPKKTQSHTFSYSQEQHQKTEQDLTELLTNLDNWLSSKDRHSFPHRNNCESNCPYYQELLVANISNKTKKYNVSDRDHLLHDIQDISEIPL
ncbi:conserved hypothetical protein [Hyella patelloides LEGE 07179]|uniref:PD-(D/E)XK endonuclease-like domain-containing protein n=1 Tax=Hyella patelloides LEGE 07179 TaxID=945734 RepID=A0A563VPI4_9CYAN|nr:PD-(D/E)XK nuclease family protein [Hyella patelloides]VEP13265.1 conserved hypothetical protein [Hyella patelloides LEGE 07179]